MFMAKENKPKILLRKLLLDIDKAFPSMIPVSLLWTSYIIPVQIGTFKIMKFNNFLDKSQWWPRSKLEEYQINKFKLLLKHAYNNVPYYAEMLRKYNLRPEDFNCIGDLKKLPILTKEDVINNFDKLISRNINKKHFKISATSGSTGKPLQFYYDKRFDFMEYAFKQRFLNWQKANRHERRIKLWSRPFIEKEVKDIYLYEPLLGRLSLSTVPHNRESLDEYLKIIQRFKPARISGNPSFLYLLACYMQEKNIDNVKFRCFSSLFENLYPYQRNLIEKQFNCEIFNRYACEERVVSAFECSRHEGMHIQSEKIILEIIGEPGESLVLGKEGRIVSTSLHNYVMPFIRYETGDVGSISEKACSCGRGLPLLSHLNGRSNEVLRYKDKYIYSATLSFIMWEFSNIKECQFVQKDGEKIIINIVKRKDYSENDTFRLIKRLKDITGDNINFEINFVENILRSQMGKFSFVVSEMKTSK